MKKWEVLRKSKFHDQHYTPIVSELDDFTIKTDIAWVIDPDSVNLIATAPYLLEALERAINEPDWKCGAPDYMHEAIRIAKEKP